MKLMMKLSALALAKCIAQPQPEAEDPYAPRRRSKGEKAKARKQRRQK